MECYFTIITCSSVAKEPMTTQMCNFQYVHVWLVQLSVFKYQLELILCACTVGDLRLDKGEGGFKSEGIYVKTSDHGMHARIYID